MPVETTVIAMISAIVLSALMLHLVMRRPEAFILKSFDKKSLLVFRIIYPAAIALSFYLYYYRIGYLKPLDGPLLDAMAIFLFAFGMVLRWTAILSLKERFTVKVTILKNHSLQTNGVYKWIRHPSYSGLLVYYVGLGLAMHNVLSLILLIVSVVPVLTYRIKIEEKFLSEHFGEAYQNYMARTYRLVPGLY